MVKYGITILLFIPLFTNAQWTAEGKEKLRKQCHGSAATSFNKEAAAFYCDCLMEKMVNGFSSEKEAASASQPEIDSLSKQCVDELVKNKEKNTMYGAWWSAEIRRQFDASCREKLKGSSVNADIYCPCALEEMIALFPDPLKVTNIKDSELFAIAQKCLK